MIFLETKRLCLRNVQPKDAPIMFDYRNDQRCARYQRGQTKDLPGIEKLVADHQMDVLGTEENCLVAVADKQTDGMIGEIIVMPNDDCFSQLQCYIFLNNNKDWRFLYGSTRTDDFVISSQWFSYRDH